MCGIIGIAGRSQVTDRLIDGLKRLEYRGYDSSGIAVLTDGALGRRRAKGKIKQLQARINGEPLDGQIGIAHTRWATHGVPNEANAHPIFCARAGSPLALGIGVDKTEHYLGSDAMAMAQLTNQLIYLEEGDWAIIRPDGYEIFDENDAAVTRDITVIEGGPALAEKGKYAHFMLKEIYEQPATVTQTLTHYLDKNLERPISATDLGAALDFSKFDRIILIACGTAYYAGAVAKYWFEQVAGLAVDIDVASEFRYRRPVLSEKALFIAISQSGETADTLAALDAGAGTIGVLSRARSASSDRF